MANQIIVRIGAALMLPWLGVAGAGASPEAAPPPLPPVWHPGSYPDEAGFQSRIAGRLEHLASQTYGRRSLARSTCPDTGRAVFTYALEGEEIVSPFTGRRYLQGPTGYFGPKARDADGRIFAFGGDPLKYDLPPATARLLLGPVDPDLLPWLSIPGNVRQHYHFAAVNWGRLFGLAGAQMPESLLADWRAAVAVYAENRRPSDGDRENLPLPYPYDLVGDPSLHLGGGGTENHKTMWRASTLLYASLLPADARISGWPRDEAAARARVVLERYARGLYTVGSGEYDSGIYYPHSFRAFLNLYDFHPDEAVRDLARSVLDQMVATAALKTFAGFQVGGQRRGYPHSIPSELDRHLALWSPPDHAWEGLFADETSLHQITSSYRPNLALHRLIRNEGLPVPFTAHFAHPSYDMSVPARHLGVQYVSSSFSLGSVQVDGINNASQQVTWSLVAQSASGRPWVLTGGQPRWRGRGGHSPYDQWVQHEGLLILLTADTVPAPGDPPPPVLESTSQMRGELGYTRHNAFAGPLRPPPRPESSSANPDPTFATALAAGATWLWVPRDGAELTAADGLFLVNTGPTYLILEPLGTEAWELAPPVAEMAARPRGDPARRLIEDRLLIAAGPPSGWVVEAVEASAYADFAAFAAAAQARPRAQLHVAPGRPPAVRAHRLDGRVVELFYEPTGLRPTARVEGDDLPFGPPDGLVVDSPVLKIGHGQMTVTTGDAKYTVEWTDTGPIWR